jgi:hypothetical protein
VSCFAKEIVFMVLLSVFVFPATGCAEQLKKGMTLSVARSLLIHQGWRTVNVHAGEKYEYIGIESLLINANIKEVESCAIDKAVCIFNYKKGNKCLRLFTHGEEVNDMRVISWTCDCPDGD